MKYFVKHNFSIVLLLKLIFNEKKMKQPRQKCHSYIFRMKQQNTILIAYKSNHCLLISTFNLWNTFS